VCVRESGVVMEQSRPDRDVTQQQDPVPHPLLVHTRTQSQTLLLPTQTAWLSMSSFGSCLTSEKRIYLVYSRKRIADTSSHTGKAV